MKKTSGIKTAIMSFQHMFAMLGATMLVPVLAGMSISIALLAAGIGTIIFYFCAKRKVPVFLGSSFAFLPALCTVVGSGAYAIGSGEWNQRMAATMIALVLAGVVYIILAIIIKVVGVKRVKTLFPPIVVGPVVIIIGMILAPKMFWNNIIGQYVWGYGLAWQEWTAAGVTALTIILVNALAKPKSFLKVIPILIGFIVGYIYSAIIGLVNINFSGDILIFQQSKELWGFWGATGLGSLDKGLVVSAILMIVPLAIVTFMEHLGDISANSTVCNQDFMVDPGLHRTVLGDGLATIASALLGGPANTTYGENTAVLAITKNYNPRNIFYAAIIAVVLGLFVPFGEILYSIPSSVVGGASIVLFGMISASGLRSLVDGKVDFSDSKNLIVVSVTLAIGLGLGAMSLAGDIVGSFAADFNPAILKIMIGQVELSPLAIATVVAIVLNLVIPNSKPDKGEPDAAHQNLTAAPAADIEE
ncbi:MAG: hypothetical protein IJP23_03535 [Oscillospiraceae bacterium]|nr:hypothetical protein [Oscillospiraceae bacterium]